MNDKLTNYLKQEIAALQRELDNYRCFLGDYMRSPSGSFTVGERSAFIQVLRFVEEEQRKENENATNTTPDV